MVLIHKTLCSAWYAVLHPNKNFRLRLRKYLYAASLYYSPAMPAPILQPYDWDCKNLMISACSFPFCSMFLQVRTSSWTSPHSSWMPYFSRSPAWRGVCVQLLMGYGFRSFETVPKNHSLINWQAETLVDRYTHTHTHTSLFEQKTCGEQPDDRITWCRNTCLLSWQQQPCMRPFNCVPNPFRPALGAGDGIYIYVYNMIFIYMYIYVYLYIYTCYIYIYTCVCIHTVYTHIYIYIYILFVSIHKNTQIHPGVLCGTFFPMAKAVPLGEVLLTRLPELTCLDWWEMLLVTWEFLKMVVAHACHTRSIWLVLSCFVELMGNRTTILYHVSSQSSGHMLAMPLPFQTESSTWRLMVEVGGLLFWATPNMQRIRTWWYHQKVSHPSSPQ